MEFPRQIHDRPARSKARRWRRNVWPTALPPEDSDAVHTREPRGAGSIRKMLMGSSPWIAFWPARRLPLPASRRLETHRVDAQASHRQRCRTSPARIPLPGIAPGVWLIAVSLATIAFLFAAGTTMLLDIGANLTHESFAHDFDAVLARAQSHGVA